MAMITGAPWVSCATLVICVQVWSVSQQPCSRYSTGQVRLADSDQPGGSSSRTAVLVPAAGGEVATAPGRPKTIFSGPTWAPAAAAPPTGGAAPAPPARAPVRAGHAAPSV